MRSKILPVQIFPGSADVLRVDSFNGIPPSYRWALESATVTPAVPATDETPEQPERTEYTTLRDGNASMTLEQWTAWTDQPDEAYILACAAKNLGVTLA